MKAVLALVAIALLGGCPSKKNSIDQQAYAKFRAFKDEMCACKDRACADRVSDRMMRWTTEMARMGEKGGQPTDKDLVEKIRVTSEEYSKCMVALMSTPAPPEPSPTPAKGDPVPRPTTPPLNLPPPSYGTLWADRLWSDARTWARERRPNHLPTGATFAYIDRHGALDPTDGEVTFTFGRTDEAASKRKLGAKVRPTPEHDDCFQLTTANGMWSEGKIQCVNALPILVRCSVAQVWARGIERKVPADALATVRLRIGQENKAAWAIVVDDAPRNVHHHQDIPDDCEIVVEK